MARCAQDNGARAVRIQGSANIESVVRRVDIPVIGMIKRRYQGFEPYITATTREVRESIAAGAGIVAFDATGRARPEGQTLREIVDSIHEAGRLTMADCAQLFDAAGAAALGVHFVATTLASYTKETEGCALPALDLVRRMKQLEPLVICEGGVKAPRHVREARCAGADAVVVGTAITDIDWLVSQFAAGVQE